MSIWERAFQEREWKLPRPEGATSWVPSRYTMQVRGLELSELGVKPSTIQSEFLGGQLCQLLEIQFLSKCSQVPMEAFRQRMIEFLLCC